MKGKQGRPPTGKGYRVNLLLPTSFRSRCKAMAEAIEADSVTELIRRALIHYEEHLKEKGKLPNDNLPT